VLVILPGGHRGLRRARGRGSLAAAGLPVAVVNPRQARDFARATGRLA
jgi:transposase